MGIPGPQELMLLALVAIGVFVLRRVIRAQLPEESRPLDSPPPAAPEPRIPAPMRLALVATGIFVVVAALVLRPWARDPLSFFSYGILPVAIAWGLGWVMAGVGRRVGRR